MKRIALAALLLLFAGSIAAQQTDTANTASKPNKTKHFSVGVTAGIDRNYHIIDMAYMGDLKYDEFCKGSAYGLQLAYSPWNWLAIRADVVLLDKDYNLNHIFQYEGDSQGRNRITTNTYTHNQYLNIPLVADLSVGRAVRLHVFGGGYYGWWLSSHRSGVSHSMNGGAADMFDEDVEFNPDRDNLQEYGLVYGAGLSVRIIDCIELNAEARWHYSVTDIQKEYMRNLNPRYNTTMMIQGGVRYCF